MSAERRRGQAEGRFDGETEQLTSGDVAGAYIADSDCSRKNEETLHAIVWSLETVTIDSDLKA